LLLPTSQQAAERRWSWTIQEVEKDDRLFSFSLESQLAEEPPAKHLTENVCEYITGKPAFPIEAHCSRGGHLRPQTGVVLKCELSMVAKTGNNQAQFPEVAADST
jgi:hypothetical protein